MYVYDMYLHILYMWVEPNERLDSQYFPCMTKPEEERCREMEAGS